MVKQSALWNVVGVLTSGDCELGTCQKSASLVMSIPWNAATPKTQIHLTLESF